MQIHLDPLKALETDIKIAFDSLQTKRVKLRQERIHRETILDSVDEAILVLDGADVVQYINQRFDQIFDTTSHSLLNKPVAELSELFKQLSDTNDKNSLSQIFADLSGEASLGIHDFETQIGASGSKYLRVFTAPIQDTDQSYIGRVWKFEDISHKKELEQMKEEFISVASHQLRTPLTAIWGYLSMINDGNYGDLPEGLRKPLQAVWHSAKRMKELVNDLLDISRIESGKIKATVVKMDLVSTIKEEVETQRDSAQQKRIDLLLLPSLPTLIIESDPKLVREMFKNYLSNAIKYTTAGKRVEVRIEFLDTKTLKICVQDQGIGVPLSEQAHLFEKFYRAANVQSDDYEGTGLGLYYVQACAKVLGGKVGFDSKEGEGSEFWFTLPYKH